MSGILLLLVILIWVAIANWLAKIATKKLPMSWWRIPVRVLFFIAMIPLPIVDELVARPQFEKLCKDNSTIQVDRATAVGRTVYLAQMPDVEISGTSVRVVLQPRRFVDVTTHEVVVSYNGLIAVGGGFVQALGVSEGRVPLTFKGWCKPGDQYALDELFKELNITLIRRPQSTHGESK